MRPSAAGSGSAAASSAWSICARRVSIPNSPEAEPLVGAELDHGAADEREPLGARVLEQVGRQLVGDLALDRGISLAILRREVDDVLVRGIGAGERDGAVLVHLLGEPARHLDRPHLGPEQAAEAALDQIGELGLEVAQNAHRRRPSAQPSGPRAGPMLGKVTVPERCSGTRGEQRRERPERARPRLRRERRAARPATPESRRRRRSSRQGRPPSR